MEKVLKSAVVLLSYCSTLFSVQVDEITDTFLNKSAYSDHVQHFQKFFQEVQIDSFLEFGVGFGTKYFLDKCKKVTSYEIILPDQTDDWFQLTQDLFKNYSNWVPLRIVGSEHLQKANLISAINRNDPALHDASYLLELKSICDEIFKDCSFEIAFVDPGFHMRGDLVNELFDRVPIIAAHDTNIAPDAYGWNKINTPFNYEKFVFIEGQGVTFWVRKDKQNVIDALQRYFTFSSRDEGKRNLRIFFPQIHPILIQSMARVLQHLGHTLVLPGESFDPHSPQSGLKISYGTFFKKNPLESSVFTSFFSESSKDCSFLQDNVEVIENDELLANPPDVLFVNCVEVEQSIYNIWDQFQKSNQAIPKLAHYSGNNNSHYDPNRVKNLIAVDAYTARNYDPSQVNIVFWIPWIDFKNLEFEGVTDSLLLNSYIAHYYNHILEQSADLFYDITGRIKVDFPEIQINSYPNKASYFKHSLLSSLINESCATIHIKETEGFGYTIIESLAKGRPVFLKRSFSQGSRLMNWCIEGRTAFFFDDYAEFHVKLWRYLRDDEFRHQVQRDCAGTVRHLINNEKQALILEYFLQNLN